MSVKLTERELYFSMSTKQWLDILEGRTDIPRTITDWNFMLTPNKEHTRFSEEAAPWVIRFAEKTVKKPDKKRAQKVVDLGAGNFSNLIGLGKNGWTNLTGVEICDKNLESGRELVAKENLDIAVVKGDVRDTKLPSAAYDIVISTYVLMTLPTRQDINTTAKEIGRLVKPDGYLILSTIGAESFVAYTNAFDRAKERYLGRQKEIEKYFGSDSSMVLHGGPIYMPKNDLLNLFSGFELVYSDPLLDDVVSTYNHRLLMKRM
jgi:SAM-dependent methyltransferase